MSATMLSKPKFWVPGDWNALFGFGTNILVNVLVLTGLLRFVLKMPDQLVFGRILPALGLMLFLSTCYYAFLAYQLAKRTGRTDVCALPSGISVPHMFVVTFVVMLPIGIATKDPVQAWEAGLTWVFVQSFVLMVGGFIGPYVRKITPRAALLGSLAGISITFISMSPAAQVFTTPVIGVVCFAVILANWFGGVKYFGGVPGGLVAIAVGTLIAWLSNLFGLGYGGLTVAKMLGSVANFGFSFPIPAVGHVFHGFQYIGVILVTAIPFGIYDLIEALDNVESAAAAGDPFPTTRVLTADGVISLIGCLLGNPFINAVYIGHPGWKAMGGRMGVLAGGDRHHRVGADLVRHHLGVDGGDPGRRHSADIALYRHADRLAGVPGIAAPSCTGDRAGAAAAVGRLGQDADRQRAGRRRHQCPRHWFRKVGPGWRAVSGAGDTRRRRHARRHHPGCDHGLYHRSRV